MMTRGMYSTTRDNWETPPDLFAKLDAEFRFTLDAAATASNAKCLCFLSPQDDALSKPWRGRVWLNPPYGRQIGKWTAKAAAEVKAGAELVVALVPARTDTAWWHDTVIPNAAEIRYLRGRVRFVGGKSAAPFPSAIVVFRGAR